VASKKQTILTLNGRRYDALTGHPAAEAPNQTKGHIISDFVGPVSSPIQVAPPVPAPTELPQPPVTVTPPGSRVMDVTRSTSHIRPRKQQPAHTLVRSAVSKPKPGLKSQTKVNAPTRGLSVQDFAVAPKLSVNEVNPHRQRRATQVTKSQSISRFSDGTVVGAVEPSPQQLAAVSTQAPSDLSSVALAKEGATDAGEQPPSKSQALFERAIAASESQTAKPADSKKLSKQAHKQAKAAAKAKKPVHHHLASVVAASVAVLAIGGFIGLQNKDSLTLRFADALPI
jgi:hypothetical protein